jgi:hypothetical protein
MSRYAWSWDQDSKSWSLAADPRCQVKDFTIAKINAGEPGYEMLIDGHVVDSASTADEAFAKLECVYEYEEHGAELALARLRLGQARARLAERYPRAAGDPQLLSILEGLGDALGVGPEAVAEDRAPDAWRRQLEPDLWLVVDASQCIVLEVTTPAGRVLRRVTVGNAMVTSAMLAAAQAEQRRILTEADDARVMGVHDRRLAEGRLTKREAVEWLIAKGLARWQAVSIMTDARAAGSYGMRFEGGYWVVPVAEAERSVQS